MEHWSRLAYRSLKTDPPMNILLVGGTSFSTADIWRSNVSVEQECPNPDKIKGPYYTTQYGNRLQQSSGYTIGANLGEHC